ncbi:unnamed protein product [Soboliphyme baturini]|uniref:Mitochondrial carrier protein n=1 Tax=Soboliphyme baturini TaxID=241478 RepID=A0A183IHI6_9BILA|nr:unnamed protein product [Soboliphyme baturini]
MASLDLSNTCQPKQVEVIEWDMMKKSKFASLNIMSSLGVRALLYPLTLVKTRMQVTSKGGPYRGALATLSGILREEGPTALYRGFWINSFQVCSGLTYVLTYERVRDLLASGGVKSSELKAFIGGGFASVTGQLILVPLDIISQHMMVFSRCTAGRIGLAMVPLRGQTDALGIAARLRESPSSSLTLVICREIYIRDGLIKGFYRGYFASLMCYAPSSALFWLCYHIYSKNFKLIADGRVPVMFANGLAAPLSGLTVAITTNFLDVFRTNIQVLRTGWLETCVNLWTKDRWNVFTKGLSARMMSTVLSSFFYLTSYEIIKRLSVHSELRDSISW